MCSVFVCIIFIIVVTTIQFRHIVFTPLRYQLLSTPPKNKTPEIDEDFIPSAQGVQFIEMENFYPIQI